MTDKEPLQISRLPDADMQGALPALRRAAPRAREIAARTGTPLITSKDGQVIEEFVSLSADDRQAHP